jgi:hypothetical protein
MQSPQITMESKPEKKGRCALHTHPLRGPLN